MWPSVPTTPAEIEKVRESILSNRLLYGSLVSIDQKAALIVAGFFESRLDPKFVCTRRSTKSSSRESDANTSIQAIGRPMLVGSVVEQSPQLGLIILVTTLSMLLVLAVYFRNLIGVIVPACAALVSAIMGFGFLGLAKQNFDPLVLVVPFIITARALSQSVQVVSRYLDDFELCKDRVNAVYKTCVALFRPGALAVIADLAGILLISLAPIPLLQKLATMGAFWFLSIFVSGMVISPILLTLLPAPPKRQARRGKLVRQVLARMAGISAGPGRVWVFGATIAILAVGLIFARRLIVGDVHPALQSCGRARTTTWPPSASPTVSPTPRSWRWWWRALRVMPSRTRRY